MENILKIVSDATEIPKEDILSRKRDAKTSDARCIFMYFAYCSGESNTSIARFIGRTQGDISHQLKKITAQIEVYKSLNYTAQEIQSVMKTFDYKQIKTKICL